jgi:hypothetical protein
LKLDIFRYKTDETVGVVVLSPESSAGNMTDKEFGDEDITETGTNTGGI